MVPLDIFEPNLESRDDPGELVVDGGLLLGDGAHLQPDGVGHLRGLVVERQRVHVPTTLLPRQNPRVELNLQVGLIGIITS